MSGYGLWFLVVVDSAVFIIFAASFFHPHTSRDWKAMGGFSAFIVALFTEMYGFPLTVYLLSGWLGRRFPELKPTHNGGHLWTDLIGWKGDPHFSPFHLASYLVIGFGFWALSAAWPVLHRSAQAGTLATSGPYARVRHPQYAGFLAIMVGFLLQWPTIPTLVMFPVLLVVYRRLAIAEEHTVATGFGPAWAAYAARTPRFVPRWRHHPTPGGTEQPSTPVRSSRSTRTEPSSGVRGARLNRSERTILSRPHLRETTRERAT